MHAVDVVEVTDVAQLVQFVVADGLHPHMALDIREVRRGRSDRGQARSRERDLGRRNKLIDDVRAAGLCALRKDLRQVVLLFLLMIEMVDRIGVIPVDPEIVRRGLKMRKTQHRLLGVSIALRIRILRHAPDTLYGRVVVYILFHHIHIRSGLGHRDVDHLDAEILGDPEMAVIAGHRAQEFQALLPAPGIASHHAMRHGAGYIVKNDVQRGVAEDQHVLRLHLGHFPHKALRLRDTAEDPVIAAVGAGLVEHAVASVQRVHKPVREVQLFAAGLAARHIQRKVLVLGLLKPARHAFPFDMQFLSRHFRICFHFESSRVHNQSYYIPLCAYRQIFCKLAE